MIDHDQGANITNAQSIIGTALATATALYDTMEDATLPPRLRKIQMKKMIEHLEDLRNELTPKDK
jgi:hypothetical protein